MGTKDSGQGRICLVLATLEYRGQCNFAAAHRRDIPDPIPLACAETSQHRFISIHVPHVMRKNTSGIVFSIATNTLQVIHQSCPAVKATQHGEVHLLVSAFLPRSLSLANYIPYRGPKRYASTLLIVLIDLI